MNFHEMGTMDLPTMLDYVLNYTQQESLNYIGYSMGTTSLFILLSTKPEYNAKIRLAICLAPVALWIKISPTFHDIISIIPPLKQFLENYEARSVVNLALTDRISSRFCLHWPGQPPILPSLARSIVGLAFTGRSTLSNANAADTGVPDLPNHRFRVDS
ncbi:Lipase [Ooceraea biroi]|uniref:Lipase n=1 Tax=Ooceraea biroi TaxID=2015173 RepID=A0A026WUP1_OOCBI|nr:Lipase [Ooceraea biroi]